MISGSSEKGWKTAKLDELAVVERGRSRHRPRNDPILYGGQHPFIQTGDVKKAEFWIVRASQTYSEVGLEQSRLWPAGTVCTTIAANIAESAVLAIDACFPDSVVGVTAIDGTANGAFLKYAIDFMKLRLQSVSGGTTQDNLSIQKLLSFDFPAPPLANQRQIGQALLRLDDLIENNRRRVELLEETARLLYLEWFVRFQYPGHEGVALVDSVHGSRPENWGHTTMGEIAELSRAAANPSEIPSLSPILSLGDLPYRSTTLHEWDLPEAAGSRKTEFKSGDILFAKLDPGSHKAVWAPIDGFCSTDILAFRATEPQFASLILSIASSDQFVAVAAKTANGTTHIRVSPDVLLNYPVLLPPAAILDEFDRVVSSMVRLCSHLATTNRCLREARNLLLPRLVSGDLDISDLELDLGTVG